MSVSGPVEALFHDAEGKALFVRVLKNLSEKKKQQRTNNEATKKKKKKLKATIVKGVWQTLPVSVVALFAAQCAE